ncbi:MAG: hypothetical protein IKG42_03150 [Clostridia bacterium]|nr:hypothetical protein [Clostridia bacterium]
MEQKKDINRSNLIIALLLVIILVLVGACYFAYSRYTTSYSGNATATVAKWHFGTQTTKISGINLATASAENMVAFSGGNNLTTGANLIAPGTKGAFAIEIDTKDETDSKSTQVGLTYDVTLSNITNKPTNLHFYSNNSYTSAIETETSTGSGKYTASYTGFISQADTATNHYVVVYWQWPYQTAGEGADVADTTDGQNAQNVTFDLTITGTQVNQTDSQVTTGASNSGTLQTTPTIQLTSGV